MSIEFWDCFIRKFGIGLGRKPHQIAEFHLTDLDILDNSRDKSTPFHS